MPATPMGHPDIPAAMCQSNVPFCVVPGYVGGHPHKPFDTGFVWHTVLGWRPETALNRGVFEYRYRCTSSIDYGTETEDNHIFDCCDASSTENVPCNVITVPKQYEAPDFYVLEPAAPSVSLV